jgi:hypothetical protein
VPLRLPQDLTKAEADMVSVFNNTDEFRKLEKKTDVATDNDAITFRDFKNFLSIRRNAMVRRAVPFSGGGGWRLRW